MFVDTSAWASLFAPVDPDHSRFVEIVKDFRRNSGVVVTTNYIVAELMALLTSPYRVPRPPQIEILNAILSAPWVEVIHIDPATEARSRELFSARPDKMWSLVDCTSFVVMQDKGIQSALLSDRHFEEAGFQRVLR